MTSTPDPRRDVVENPDDYRYPNLALAANAFRLLGSAQIIVGLGLCGVGIVGPFVRDTLAQARLPPWSPLALAILGPLVGLPLLIRGVTQSANGEALLALGDIALATTSRSTAGVSLRRRRSLLSFVGSIVTVLLVVAVGLFGGCRATQDLLATGGNGYPGAAEVRGAPSFDGTYAGWDSITRAQGKPDGLAIDTKATLRASADAAGGVVTFTPEFSDGRAACSLRARAMGNFATLLEGQRCPAMNEPGIVAVGHANLTQDFLVFDMRIDERLFHFEGKRRSSPEAPAPIETSTRRVHLDKYCRDPLRSVAMFLGDAAVPSFCEPLRASESPDASLHLPSDAGEAERVLEHLRDIGVVEKPDGAAPTNPAIGFYCCP